MQVWDLLMRFKGGLSAVFRFVKSCLFAVRNFPLMQFKRKTNAVCNNYLGQCNIVWGIFVGSTADRALKNP